MKGYRPAPPREVYFIRAALVPSMVKIGCTRWPERRLKTLQALCPVPLVMAARFSGDHQLERRIHDALVSHRSHGEWFFDGPQVGEIIEALARG